MRPIEDPARRPSRAAATGSASRLKTVPDSTPTGEPEEPIAADARPEGDGKPMALIKVAADLIVLPFDNREPIADIGDCWPLKQSEPEPRGRHRSIPRQADPVLASYRAAQSSADRLAKADPGNADWQCVCCLRATLCGDDPAWFDGQT
jgi:hypothetical protein